MVFNSLSALQREIEARAINAVDITKQQIELRVKMALQHYYGEYAPKYYESTFAFLSSVMSIGAHVEGNSVVAEVKLDEGYLGMQYPTGKWTGFNVADSAENGLHGGYAPGTPFWTNAINSLGGEAGIKQLLVNNLIMCGLPIG